jgi:hypothetical protein
VPYKYPGLYSAVYGNVVKCLKLKVELEKKGGTNSLPGTLAQAFGETLRMF